MDLGQKALLLAAVTAATIDADRAFLSKADELGLAPSAAVELRALLAGEFQLLSDLWGACTIDQNFDFSSQNGRFRSFFHILPSVTRFMRVRTDMRT